MGPNDLLSQHISSLLVSHGEAHGFWRFLKRDGEVVYFKLFAPDDSEFVIRLDCDDYVVSPIGGRFVDPETLELSASGWPSGNATFQQWMKVQPSNLFICWVKDRFAIRNHHREWESKKQWKNDENPLYAYLEFLRQLLHIRSRGYSGWKSVA